MGKKNRKNKHRKETRLDRKLRKLAKEGGVAAASAAAPHTHTEVETAAAAAAPAEVQLGGGEMLGSIAHVAAVTDAAPAPPRSAMTSVPAHAAAQDGASPGATQATADAGRSGAQVVRGAGSAAGGGARPFDLVDGRPAYDLFRAIQTRRSHKHFRKRPVPRRALEVMLEAAVLAPNHKMTEPWGFVVLGERARRRYGAIRAAVKVGDDVDGRAEKRARIIDEVVAIPAIIAVKMRVDADEVRREEDYAATFMAVQNLLLAGVALGLGTKINTGRTMDHPDVRALVGVRDDERIVAFVNVGVPAESRGPGSRTPASERTTWLD